MIAVSTGRRATLALIRGPVLFALALAGLPLFAMIMVTMICGWSGPVRWARPFTNLARRLARDWSGVDVEEPYVPPPPPPVPGPDGRYRAGNVTYQKPGFPAYLARMDWLTRDPATGRDHWWMLLNPLVSAVLTLPPVALPVAGAALPGAVGLPAVTAVPLALACLAGGLAIAPGLIHLHGRWIALLLKPSGKTMNPVGSGTALVRAVSLLGLSLLGLVMFAVHLLGLALTLGLGLVFVFPPLVEYSRWLPNLRRQLARDWSGVDIPVPYRPRAPVPLPDVDGLYRDGRQVYETPRMIAFNRRWNWIVKDPATWRDLLWLLIDPLVAGLLLAPLALAGYGIHGLLLPQLWMPLAARKSDWYGAVAGSAWAAIPVGIALVALAMSLAGPSVRLANRWTAVLLGPTERARLALRVQQLTRTRADAVDAQAAELRRIERDLHDGAQARLVAVGLSLSTMESLIDRDPAAAKALLGQVRDMSARALRELRDLVRGIHPPVLAERGLGDAVRALALDSPIPVTVSVDLPGRPAPPVESAAYFGVAEALANAARHGDARRIGVDVRYREGTLRVAITDDGRGGADPARGSGLQGIERRLGTFDGTLTVTSPAGGPTTVTMEIPCVLSSPRTSTS